MTALTQKASGRVWLLLLAVVAIGALLFTALLPAGANEIEPITVRNIAGDACRSTDLEDFGVEPFSVDAFPVVIPRGGDNSPVFSQTLDIPGGGTITVTSPSNRKFVEFETTGGVEVQGAIYFNRNNQKLGNLYDYRPLSVSSGTVFPPPKDSGQEKQVVFCFNSKADPTVSLSTTGAIVGGNVSASALVANGDTFEANSVLTFTLHQGSCDGTQIGNSQDKAIGNGTIDADDITVSTAGTYYWKATFLGDANNNAASDCKPVTVSKATPTITVTTTGATVGDDIKALADVSDGFGYTGATELVFTLHETSCDGAVIAGPDGKTMTNGTIDASDVTTTGAGTFYWKASFAGDDNNNAQSDCASVVVSAATPTVTVAADETDVVTGDAISAKATLAAGFAPTGAITFELFSSDTCSGTAVATADATEAVTGNGMYSSMDVTDVIPFGTYYWKATYGGDDNNTGASDCGAAVQIYQQGVACTESGFEPGDDGLIALGVAFERGFDLIDGKDSCDVGEIPVTLEISETEVTFDFPTNAIYPGARFMVRIDWNPTFPTVNPFNPPDRQVAYDVNGSYVTGEACTGTDAPPGVVPTTAFTYDHPVDTPVCLAGEQLLLTPDGWQQIQFWDVLYDPKWKF